MFLFFVYPIVVIILAILVIFQPAGLNAVDMFGGGRSSSVFSVKSSKSMISRVTGIFIAIFFILTFLLSGFYIKKSKYERDVLSRDMKDELINMDKKNAGTESKIESNAKSNVKPEVGESAKFTDIPVDLKNNSSVDNNQQNSSNGKISDLTSQNK